MCFSCQGVWAEVAENRASSEWNLISGQRCCLFAIAEQRSASSQCSSNS